MKHELFDKIDVEIRGVEDSIRGRGMRIIMTKADAVILDIRLPLDEALFLAYEIVKADAAISK